MSNDMKLIHVSRAIYLEHFKYIEANTIDTDQLSNAYYAIEQNGALKAFVGVRRDKNSILTLNGLFSLEKGYGKELVNAITEQLKPRHLRLNCIGSGLVKYYSDLGFRIYFEDGNYFEMMKRIAD